MIDIPTATSGVKHRGKPPGAKNQPKEDKEGGSNTKGRKEKDFFFGSKTSNIFLSKTTTVEFGLSVQLFSLYGSKMVVAYVMGLLRIYVKLLKL